MGNVVEEKAASLVVLSATIATSIAACSSTSNASNQNGWDGYGIEGRLGEDDAPLGKADSARVKGPAVDTDITATQVWTARNAWEDKDPAAGVAWGENIGLNWDQKYSTWIDSMEKLPSKSHYDTFEFTTPWGKTLPSPKFKCAELAIFLQITFAAWHELLFFLTATDGSTRVYFGHFGARTATSRYKNTPNYANSYTDHSNMSPAEDRPIGLRMKRSAARVCTAAATTWTTFSKVLELVRTWMKFF